MGEGHSVRIQTLMIVQAMVETAVRTIALDSPIRIAAVTPTRLGMGVAVIAPTVTRMTKHLMAHDVSHDKPVRRMAIPVRIATVRDMVEGPLIVSPIQKWLVIYEPLV
jgi:hypothetical protein